MQNTGHPWSVWSSCGTHPPDRIEMRGILETSSETEGVALTVALKELEEILEVEVR